MRLLTSLLAALAASFLAMPASAVDLTQGNTGISPAGATFQLQLVLPLNDYTFGKFTVFENGSVVPGCSDLFHINPPDLFGQVPGPVSQAKLLSAQTYNDPVCLVPTPTTGWRAFDIVYLANGAARYVGHYRLQVVDAPLPVFITLPPGAALFSGKATFTVDLVGPPPQPYPGDPSSTPNVSVPVGQLSVSLDGAPVTCRSLAADTYVFAVQFSSFSCTAPATKGVHGIEARFEGAGYTTTTLSGSLAVRDFANIAQSPMQLLPKGAPVQVVATVRENATANPVEAGQVAFSEGGIAIAGCEAVPVSGGMASCQVPTPTAGWHHYQLAFTSDQYFPATNDAFVYVGPATLVATSTILQAPASTGPTHRNDARAFTAIATPVAPNAPAPLGAAPGFFTFAFDGIDYVPCTHLRNAASVTCYVVGLREGRVNVTARFEADPGFANSAASVITPVVHGPLADFDGNYKADILWSHTSGKAALWLMSDFQQIGGGVLFEGGSGWAPKLVGDFDGNERGDILFEHTDGRTGAWLMNGSTQVGGAILIAGGTGWSAKRLADFDGDGKSDILWEHTDGRVAIWLMDGLVQKGGGIVLAAGTGWHPKLTADFNGDGTADILWMHDDGTPAIWLMQGTTIIGGGRLFGAGTGWLAKFTGDFDGDGKSDIVWTHPDGRVAVWLMDGIASPLAKVIRPVGSGDAPVGVGRVVIDGRAGIVWRLADGSVIRTAMDGVTETGAGPVFPASAGATVVRVADFYGQGVSGVLASLADGSVALYTSGAHTLLAPGTGWTPLAFPE